jgi:hypothetical protein
MKHREEYRKSIGRTTVPPGSLAEQVQYGKPTTDMKIWRTPTTMDTKEDSLKHATKLVQGKNLRSTGSRIQITRADEVMVEEIMNNPELMEKYKDYEMMPRKNLPEQQDSWIHERTDISQGAARKDRDQEDDSRALVQEGQSRIQSSIDRGLEQNQTASEDNQIRQRDDSTSLNRMERRDENVENSRRTLQSRTELGETNEDEVGEGYANQHQRSGSASESNVADTYARLSNGTYEEVQSRGQTFDTSSKGSTDVADTESSNRDDYETITRDGGSSTQEVFGNGSSVSGESSWWHTEPDVGRVAHGIPGRVYRLKGLGNSIVPKIAEEIGKAIIEAEREE